MKCPLCEGTGEKHSKARKEIDEFREFIGNFPVFEEKVKLFISEMNDQCMELSNELGSPCLLCDGAKTIDDTEEILTSTRHPKEPDADENGDVYVWDREKDNWRLFKWYDFGHPYRGDVENAKIDLRFFKWKPKYNKTQAQEYPFNSGDLIDSMVRRLPS